MKFQYKIKMQLSHKLKIKVVKLIEFKLKFQKEVKKQ